MAGNAGNVKVTGEEEDGVDEGDGEGDGEGEGVGIEQTMHRT